MVKNKLLSLVLMIVHSSGIYVIASAIGWSKARICGGELAGDSC